MYPGRGTRNDLSVGLGRWEVMIGSIIIDQQPSCTLEFIYAVHCLCPDETSLPFSRVYCLQEPLQMQFDYLNRRTHNLCLPGF